jgi:hypothetical protein
VRSRHREVRIFGSQQICDECRVVRSWRALITHGTPRLAAKTVIRENALAACKTLAIQQDKPKKRGNAWHEASRWPCCCQDVYCRPDTGADASPTLVEAVTPL